MAQQKNTRLEKQQLDALEDMVTRGVADNESEAHRMLLRAGMHEYGYKNGEHTNTLLKYAVTRVAWLFTLGGIIGLAFTFAYPVPARVPSFAVLSVGVILFSASKLLEDHEPDVTRWLKGVVGGEAA